MELESPDITPIALLETALDDLKSGKIKHNKVCLVLLDDVSMPGKFTNTQLRRGGPNVFESIAMMEIAKHDLLQDTIQEKP